MIGKALKIILLLSLFTFSVAACGQTDDTSVEPDDTSTVVTEDASDSSVTEEMPAEDETVLENAPAEDDAASEEMLDLTSAAAQLGVSEEELMNALGDPSEGPPDLEAAAEALSVSQDELNAALGIEMEEEAPYRTVTINGVDFEINYDLFTWADLPADVVYERQSVQSYTDENGVTHWYEAVHVSSGNLNWYQAANLAQDAGGYLASPTTEGENNFVFELVNDEKYFWAFEEDGDHYGISIGPFLGGYQPAGSEEPAGGWSWLSGEEWSYANWAVNLDDGVIDKDPRPNDQPNDSGDEEGSQPIMGYGEMNEPVPTWGDYMGAVGTYGETKLPGFSYGFVIEYEVGVVKTR